VLNNLSENIQLSDVADHCYVSHTHLSRMFKEIRGITFKQFLLRARVDRALELLEDPGIAVTEICYEVGFRDASHFGRIFRRYVGTSPSLYRKTALDNKRGPFRNIRRAPDWLAVS
jgi:two-component system response regulator YesN